MELPNQDVCLQKLEEFIQDEDKIVSTWIAKRVYVNIICRLQVHCWAGKSE